MSNAGYMTPGEHHGSSSDEQSEGHSNNSTGEQIRDLIEAQTDVSSSVEGTTECLRTASIVQGTSPTRRMLQSRSISNRARASEYRHHMSFLSGTGNGHDAQDSQNQETRTAPLFSGGILTMHDSILQQYGLLGQRLDIQQKMEDSQQELIEMQESDTEPARVGDDVRLFLNTNTPWSAFICGSQGSGKSHTLSVMLENALMPSTLGKLPRPLAAIVFHYDRFTSYASNQICESAYLCSAGIPVKVLVSPTNYWHMKAAYQNLPGLPAHAAKPEVVPLLFNERHLDVSRMMNLMCVSEKDGPMPLYIETILRILRQMAIERQGAPGLPYRAFKHRLSLEGFSMAQNGPLKLRLDLLDSFMDGASKGDPVVRTSKPDFPPTKNGRKAETQWIAEYDATLREETARQVRLWDFAPGSLTIVDLSCPFVDDSAACALFTICLELFLDSRGDVGRVIALDEAHKFMTGTASAEKFTENLLQVIRQQRHLATRVIIATQEPTISPKLLDLSSMTIVHRFTSPEWLLALKSHLAGVSTTDGESRRDVREIFKTIVNLEAGQALLFSPSAVLDVAEDRQDEATTSGTTKLGMGYLKIRVRKRLTADGGRSIMAV